MPYPILFIIYTVVSTSLSVEEISPFVEIDADDLRQPVYLSL